MDDLLEKVKLLDAKEQQLSLILTECKDLS